MWCHQSKWTGRRLKASIQLVLLAMLAVVMYQTPQAQASPPPEVPPEVLPQVTLQAAPEVSAPTPQAEASSSPSAGYVNRRCYECHGQIRIGELSKAQRHVMVRRLKPTMKSMSDRSPARPDLYLPPGSLKESTHRDLACVDCHADAQELPHTPKLQPANCTTSCHHPQAVLYRRSIHATAASMDNPIGPRCATCHGGHDVRSKNDPKSVANPTRMHALCLSCHQNKGNSKTSPGNDKVRIPLIQYSDRLHDMSWQLGPVELAVTCVSCHQNHNILSHNDKEAPVNRQNISKMCSQCHEGIAQTYAKSIHGQKFLEQNPKAPSCVVCHPVHKAAQGSDEEEQAWDIVQQCGHCHDQPGPDKTKASLYQTYKQSYHGRVSQLGSKRAALCSDCHGMHDIQPVADPRSRLHAYQRVRTCAKCHPGANAKFIQYMPHADYRDGSRYPLLHGVWLYFMVLMALTLGLFGLHNLLWWNRTRIERRRPGATVKHDASGPVVYRFRRVDRFNHALMIVCFFGLTLTGMPKLFADKSWARGLAGIWGGIDYCGSWHRLFAVVLLFNFIIHILWASRRVRQRIVNGALFDFDTLWPRGKDLQDLWAMCRWFVGRGKKPQFGRWAYWEKFDYWAEIAGMGIIGATGLLLLMPTFFSQWIPGWTFNLAAIIHGYEALLAVGFIVSIHLFNANLRVEKFPVDKTIFTGRMLESEFKEERPLEYERLVASGQLEKIRATPPSRWQQILATVLGIIAMLIGIGLVGLMVLAGLRII